jgi:hypothetical protein
MQGANCLTFGGEAPDAKGKGMQAEISEKKGLLPVKKKANLPAAARALERKQKFQGWRTTDEEEIERRRLRASQEPMRIKPAEPEHPFYGTFACHSKASGRTYLVEIRSLTQQENSCQCPDYLSNGLGTCKHIEAVLSRLAKGGKRRFERAAQEGSPRVEVYLSRRGAPEIKVAWAAGTSRQARRTLSPFFSNTDSLLADPVVAFPALKRAIDRAPETVRQEVHIGMEVEPWGGGRGRSRGGVKGEGGVLGGV